MLSEIHGLRFMERDRAYLIIGRGATSAVAYGLVKGGREEHNRIGSEDI
jgi:hypothetical protein